MSLLQHLPVEEWPRLLARIGEGRLESADSPDALADISGVPSTDIQRAQVQIVSEEMDKLRHAQEAAANACRDDETWQELQRGFQSLSHGRNPPLASEAVLRLRMNGRDITLRYRRGFNAFFMLKEIFFDGIYSGGARVNRVYDLGANIGLSAVYFHAMHPQAELVCVEPAADCVALLRRNLDENGIRASVIEAAVADQGGVMEMQVSRATDGSNSLFAWNLWMDIPTAPRRIVQVPVIPIDEVVTGQDYGLKMDIEGAEHLLTSRPEVIRNAAWIVGELHFGPPYGSAVTTGKIVALLREHFELEVAHPLWLGSDVAACNFKAIKKRSGP